MSAVSGAGTSTCVETKLAGRNALLGTNWSRAATAALGNWTLATAKVLRDLRARSEVTPSNLY